MSDDDSLADANATNDNDDIHNDEQQQHVLTLHKAIEKIFSRLQECHILPLLDKTKGLSRSIHSHSIYDASASTTNSNCATATATATFLNVSSFQPQAKKDRDIQLNAIQFANQIQEQRLQSIQQFKARLNSRLNTNKSLQKSAKSNENDDVIQSCDDTSTHNNGSDMLSIDSVTIVSSKNNFATTNNLKNPQQQQQLLQLTSLEFKQQYIHSNIPCLIQNLNQNEFRPVSTNWVQHENQNEHCEKSVDTRQQLTHPSEDTIMDMDMDMDMDMHMNIIKNEHGFNNTTITATTSKPKPTCINTDWFLNEIGSSTLVPIRQQPQPQTSMDANNDDNCSSKFSGDGDTSGNSGTSVGMGENHTSGLDEDGRAMECQTNYVTMEHWIHLIKKYHEEETHHEQSENKDVPMVVAAAATDDDNPNIIGDQITNWNPKKTEKRQQQQHAIQKMDSTMYLKDWHLQSMLEDKWSVVTAFSSIVDSKTQSSTTSTTISAKTSPKSTTANESDTPSCNKHILYTVPNIFAGDVFNPFLLSNDGGDYRFVYWGPKGSQTPIHSDVLNTFSWSYNVFGEKKWIFYPPSLSSYMFTSIDNKVKDKATSNHNNNPNEETKYCFEIIQKTGETVYVPSGWKHSVHNLQETLSINHN